MRTLKSKIKSPAALKKALSRHRKAKVVFTNGCFDLLHRGHVTYLENAKKLGTLLVVALNTSESVQKLKGPTRPINDLKSRQEVIAALESVDYVTFFGEETPLDLIKLLKPHVLVKGGDWKVESIVGAKEVLSWGGKVRSISFVEGYSTTKTIEKMNRK